MAIQYFAAISFAASALIAMSASASIIVQERDRNPNPISFSMYDNTHSLFLSKTSYCDPNGLKNWTCPTCSKYPGVMNVTVAHGKKEASQGFVAYDSVKNRIYYVFRGTVNNAGWIADFKFFQTPYPDCPGCTVHKGLYTPYVKMAATLLPAIQALVYQHPTADIDISGHSMGGAQGTFGLMDILTKIKGRSNSSAIRCYTFGVPRIVNVVFAETLLALVEKDAKVVHFYNCNYRDPICLLAPIIYKVYTQTPREIFFPNGGQMPPIEHRLCHGTPAVQDRSCSSQTNFLSAVTKSGFVQHSYYLNNGMGCFLSDDDSDDDMLSPAARAEAVRERQRVKTFGMEIDLEQLRRMLDNLEK